MTSKDVGFTAGSGSQQIGIRIFDFEINSCAPGTYRSVASASGSECSLCPANTYLKKEEEGDRGEKSRV